MDEGPGKAAVLTAVDVSSGWTGATMARQKGAGDKYVLQWLVRVLGTLPYDRICIQADPENSHAQLAKHAATCTPKNIDVRTTPVASKQSDGCVERARVDIQGLTRTYIEALVQAYDVSLGPGRWIVPWIIRHAGWGLTRFQPRADGHSSYFHIHGKEFAAVMIPIGETVLWRRPGPRLQ
eukprot:11337322-Alexandrium_andersonii.AAC.2